MIPQPTTRHRRHTEVMLAGLLLARVADVRRVPRHVALYVAVVEAGVPKRAVAAAAGIDRRDVRRAVARVEDGREADDDAITTLAREVAPWMC